MLEIQQEVDIPGLVRRSQQGDQGAFGELYGELSPTMYGFVLRLVGGNRELAEDLTSGGFLKVYERLDRYQDRGLPFQAWVYRIFRNHVIDHVRGQSKAIVSSIEVVPEVAIQPATVGANFVNSIAARAELVEALERLTGDQRKVVELRFLKDMTTPETAEALGKSGDAVKKLQARAFENMRRNISVSRTCSDRDSSIPCIHHNHNSRNDPLASSSPPVVSERSLQLIVKNEEPEKKLVDLSRYQPEDAADLTDEQYKLACVFFPTDPKRYHDIWKLDHVAKAMGRSKGWVDNHRLNLSYKLWYEHDAQRDPGLIPPLKNVLLQRLDSIQLYAHTTMKERDQVMWFELDRETLEKIAAERGRKFAARRRV